MKTIQKMILFATALIAGSGAISQSNFDDNRISWGVKGGLNLSNVYDERDDDFVADGKLGLVAGTYLAIPIGSFLGFQPELHFSQRGFRGTGVINGNFYELKRTSNFIDIPLLFAFRPVPSFSIVAGPQFSYLVSQRDVFANASQRIAVEQEFDNDDIRNNIGCFVGGFDIAVDRIIIGARGGLDMQYNRANGPADTPRYKNTWAQVTVGVRF